MRIKAVVNPFAGRELLQKQVVKKLCDLTEKGIIDGGSIDFAKPEGNVGDIIRETEYKENDVVLAIGGDGTLNCCVNAIMNIKEPNIKPPLLVLAAGTVNDFAYTLNLPHNLEELERVLKNHRIEKVDLGKTGDTYFLNVCAAGFLTEASYGTPRLAKTIFGRTAYFIKAVTEIPKLILKPINFRFDLDGEIEEGVYSLFFVTNSRSVGGFRNAAPEASVTDGYLDFFALSQNANDFLAGGGINLLYRLGFGEHIGHPALLYKQVKCLKVSSDRDSELTVDYDGEQGPSLPAEICVVPKAIEMLLPTENFKREKNFAFGLGDFAELVKKK